MFACMYAPGLGERLVACAQHFSPRVERTGDDTVILDISGLAHLFGTEHEIAHALARRAGVPVNVAASSNPDAAFHAARGFSGIHIIPHGDEGKYLASLPVDLLSPSPEMAETFARWGIRTFRDLAALPDIGVAARLGEEGVRLQKLARGEGDRPLVTIEAPPRFEAEMELEDPLDLLEPLLFVLARLLGEVCAQLEDRALAAIGLRLWLKLENAGVHECALRLPVPMRSPRVFLKLLELNLNEHPPAAPILKVSITAEPAKPRVTQNGLFLPLAPEPEKLELTLARIAAVVGKDNVGSPKLLDTHHPSAFRMSSIGILACAPLVNKQPHRQEFRCHLAFRRFRSPLAAKVQANFLSAPGIRGKILKQTGPWRTSGDWWTSDPWSRDEWEIELTDGAIYRIYCDYQTGRWFIEGSYD